MSMAIFTCRFPQQIKCPLALAADLHVLTWELLYLFQHMPHGPKWLGAQGGPRVMEGEPCEFELPSSILRDRPPQYETVRRNVWSAGLPRPKRLPKDDIPVCCCQPPRPPPGAFAAVAFAPSAEVGPPSAVLGN